jgi:hypothetical protein
VHLAVSYDAAAEPTARRERTVTGTAAVLGRPGSGGGARRAGQLDRRARRPAAGRALPLPEDLPLRVDPDSALTGDLLELERLAARAAAGGLEVVLLRRRRWSAGRWDRSTTVRCCSRWTALGCSPCVGSSRCGSCATPTTCSRR